MSTGAVKWSDIDGGQGFVAGDSREVTGVSGCDGLSEGRRGVRAIADRPV